MSNKLSWNQNASISGDKTVQVNDLVQSIHEVINREVDDWVIKGIINNYTFEKDNESVDPKEIEELLRNYNYFKIAMSDLVQFVYNDNPTYATIKIICLIKKQDLEVFHNGWIKVNTKNPIGSVLFSIEIPLRWNIHE